MDTVKEIVILMFRDRFHIPNCTAYLGGMSLGCQPRATSRYINEELEVWSEYGVLGHGPDHPHGRPWMSFLENKCCEQLAPLLGANKQEIAVMGELTSNLNMLLLQFYHPERDKRYKILMEAGPFPSDQFMVEGHVERCGFSIRDAIVYVEADASGLISDDRVCQLLENDKSIALLLLSAVQYRSGQFFDNARIAKAAKDNGVMIGLDLAHAIGNVPLSLHGWDIDFAAWCSYKYLNAGPGCIAGIFVHSKHDGVKPVMRGWWGSQVKFEGSEFVGRDGAGRFAQSNPGIISLACLAASLDVFSETDIITIRENSYNLCGLFRQKAADLVEFGLLKVLTPMEKSRSGAQLALQFPRHDAKMVSKGLSDNGVICDLRGGIIRVSFTGLYNDFQDVEQVISVLIKLLK